jgi:hypothetical protein
LCPFRYRYILERKNWAENWAEKFLTISNKYRYYSFTYITVIS